MATNPDDSVSRNWWVWPFTYSKTRLKLKFFFTAALVLILVRLFNYFILLTVIHLTVITFERYCSSLLHRVGFRHIIVFYFFYFFLSLLCVFRSLFFSFFLLPSLPTLTSSHSLETLVDAHRLLTLVLVIILVFFCLLDFGARKIKASTNDARIIPLQQEDLQMLLKWTGWTGWTGLLQ